MEQQEFTQYFPQSGWVEHDADEIWKSQCETLQTLVIRHSLSAKNVKAVGITNQRETLVAWDKVTGQVLHRAMVWQDRRTTERCQSLKKKGLEAGIRQKTGLLLDPYFSATKAEWLLHHSGKVKASAKAGRLALGTIDSFLAFRLTAGKRHVTEPSNASRTLLFNLHTLDWDASLLRLFNIPRHALPEILASDADFGTIDLPFLRGVKIHGMIGDQQAALFGNRCFGVGDIKSTYGTGCFLLKNMGAKPKLPPRGLLGTVAWSLGGKPTYAHEGSVLIGGAVVQFLRDGLGLLSKASDSEGMAESVQGNDGVYFVPAFAGLGTPYWDPNARGLLIGLTRGTSKAHIVRAALESIAFQTEAVFQVFGANRRNRFRVDGGGSHNRFLMQFQSDILGARVEVSDNPEATALGAAMLAALGAEETTMGQLKKMTFPTHAFRPMMKAKEREKLIGFWKKAVARSRGWAIA